MCVHGVRYVRAYLLLWVCCLVCMPLLLLQELLHLQCSLLLLDLRRTQTKQEHAGGMSRDKQWELHATMLL